MEKKEPSCTIGGNVNWYSHCGEQDGVSLRNEKQNYHVTQQPHCIYEHFLRISSTCVISALNDKNIFRLLLSVATSFFCKVSFLSTFFGWFSFTAAANTRTRQECRSTQPSVSPPALWPLNIQEWSTTTWDLTGSPHSIQNNYNINLQIHSILNAF